MITFSHGVTTVGPIFFKNKTGKITKRISYFRLVKEQSRLGLGLYDRKHSFSQRTLNEWNKLPAECVHSSRFKNRINHYHVREHLIQ